MVSPTHGSIKTQIPFDIWDHIATFIPDNELTKLYSINRAFFHISMARKYHSISTNTKRGPLRERRWYRMSQNPIPCRYVRSLQFNNTDFPVIWPGFASHTQAQAWSERELSWFENSSLKNILRYFTKAAREERRLERGWKMFVNLIDQVTDLNINWWLGPPIYLPPLSLVESLLAPCWNSFGSNLRSLSLCTAPPVFGRILVPALHLQKIESFSLELSWYEDRQVDLEYLKPVAAFINKHSATLQKLSLISHTDVPTSSIQYINHIPLLQQLEIQQCYLVPKPVAQGLCTFLHSHHDTLTDIKFTFCANPGSPTGLKEWFDQQLFNITLPNLCSLVLRFWFPSILPPPNLSIYVARHSQTLTKLSILEFSPSWLTVTQFHHLLHALTQKPKESPLRVLSIDMKTMSPTTFCTLADKLPLLREFNLGYILIDSPDPSTPRLTCLEWFDKNLQLPALKTWSLETLRFFRKRGVATRPELGKRVESRVVQNIPGVKFIDGQGREEYLRENGVNLDLGPANDPCD